jgi:protein O-GlcNAc transferase
MEEAHSVLAKTFKRPKPVSAKRHKTAVDLYRDAVALMHQDRQAEAKELAGRILGLDEGFAPAWDLLSAVLANEQNASDAELAARKALALDSNLQSATVALGVALMQQRKYQDAAVHLGAAVKKFPQSVQMWMCLSGALISIGASTQAEFCYRRVLELQPDHAQARLQLANLLAGMARTDDARKEIEAAATVGSAEAELRAAQLISPMPVDEEQIHAERERFASEIERLSRTLAPVNDLPDCAAVTNFYLAYHGMDDRPLQESWARLLSKVCPSFCGDRSREPRRPARGERLRVGFISSYLKDRHTISKLNAGLMRQLPRDRFEVIAFDLSASTDPGYLPKFADKVVQCSAHPFRAVAEIGDAELDVAYFPDIGMHPAANRIAFSRLAPVQCTTWGHPVTSGLPSVDYFLSSDLIEPAGAEAHYTEQLVRLSTLPTYYFRTGRTTRRMPEFPSDWHIYLCPQSLFKFHPRFDAVWAEILRRDPAGRLILVDRLGEYSNKLGDRISAKYPDIIDRVVFLNRMPVDELMGIMQACHVMLDTNPFGGGNTSYEAFALGTPIVTVPGEYMRGRVTLGCYRKMGFEECVAGSIEQYVESALRLACDREYRHWVGSQILERRHVLYEDQRAVDEIAEFFERACAAAADGHTVAFETNNCGQLVPVC